MATATKTEIITVTLALSREEAEELRTYLGARPSLAFPPGRVRLTDNIYQALASVLAPF